MKIIKKILSYWKIYITFALSILLSFTFDLFDFGYENILLLFIISIVLIIMESKSFFFGIFSTILFVLFFNYFFTDPRYTFIIEESRYIITLVIFLIVSFLISSLMQRLQLSANKAVEGERKTEALYTVAKKLLSIRNLENINLFFSEVIFTNTKITNYIYMDGKIFSIEKQTLNFESLLTHIDFSIKSGSHVGIGTAYKPDLPFRIIGITGIENHQIALLLETQRNLEKEELDFIKAIINLYKVVSQKEIAKIDEEQTRLLAENERFKNQILRSISHDLKTPLTIIMTGSSMLYQNQKLSEETKNEIIQEIIEEVESMTLLIDNILQMTKFQNQEVKLHKSKESVDEIISRAVNIIQKRLKNHRLIIDGLDEVIIVNVDAKLIVQVLVNLLDNVIQHTQEDSKIAIEYKIFDKYLTLSVSDNGGGINEKDLEFIFDSNYFSKNKKDNRRGFGLGLSICKSIIDKHNGKIHAFNNENKGATFEIELPL